MLIFIMDLSIIIPVYNSSNILKKLIKQIIFTLNKNLIKSFEIILVNDNSKDSSWDTIKQLSKKYKNIKGLSLKYNFGQHSAIFAGMKNSKGKKIVTMDDDLQHSPQYIINIYNSLNKFDLCYAIYKKRKHNFWKKLASQLNNIYASFIFNKSFKIYISSFRGFTVDVKNKCIKYKGIVIFLDSLLLKNSPKKNLIKIIHRKRLSGKSNYNFKRLFRLLFDSIENFHFLPLRLGTLIGIISFFIVKTFRFFSRSKKFQFQISKKTF